MKKSKYQLFEEIAPSMYLHYSSLTNNFLLLNEKDHHLLEGTEDCSSIEKGNKVLYEILINNLFIVKDDFDECQFVLDKRQRMTEDNSMYNVVVNPTLDCNLSCWYCYEKRVMGSKISIDVIKAIERNIELHYKTTKYNTLKLSFFGGEPFVRFDAIKQLLDFSKNFCQEREIELIADFTTNATLITNEIIDYLKQFRCHFQITLDGGRSTHNKVKIDKASSNGTYDRTLSVLKLINDRIEKHWLAVRINFNNQTLRDINEIINDIDFLDRKNCCVILKKVWQIKTERVDKDNLTNAIQTFFDRKFLVDYYVMPKGCVCFAERRNQVLFNYDGKIFKCTTIPSFDDENTLGTLDLNSGKISWNKSRTDNWYADMQTKYCKECKWFPVCLGVCNRQLIVHQGEHICTFDAMNLDQREYLMYLFKFNILRNELYK